jgi:hypothetical protein
MIDKTKIDLDAVAYKNDNAPVEVEEPSSSAEEAVVEESRVPYSRFKTAHERRLEAEEEARIANERYQELLNRQSRSSSPIQDSGDDWDRWVAMHGDSEASKRAYDFDQQRLRKIEELAEQRALEAIDRREEYQTRAISSNIEKLDEDVEFLEDQIGRRLTPKEEETILDIRDEYTAKDRNGNYAGELLPIEKAWEILELTSKRSNRSRDEVTSLTNSSTQGESLEERRERDTNWRPGNWTSYSNRV